MKPIRSPCEIRVFISFVGYPEEQPVPCSPSRACNVRHKSFATFITIEVAIKIITTPSAITHNIPFLKRAAKRKAV